MEKIYHDYIQDSLEEYFEKKYISEEYKNIMNQWEEIDRKISRINHNKSWQEYKEMVPNCSLPEPYYEYHNITEEELQDLKNQKNKLQEKIDEEEEKENSPENMMMQFIERVNNDEETEEDREIIDLIAKQYLEEFHLEYLEKEMEKEEWYFDDESGNNDTKLRRIGLGSFVYPSGKYYMPFACGNIDSVEGKIDESFTEQFEEKLNYFQKRYSFEADENDPVYSFIVEYEEFDSENEVFTKDNVVIKKEDLDISDFKNKRKGEVEGDNWTIKRNIYFTNEKVYKDDNYYSYNSWYKEYTRKMHREWLKNKEEETINIGGMEIDSDGNTYKQINMKVGNNNE